MHTTKLNNFVLVILPFPGMAHEARTSSTTSTSSSSSGRSSLYVAVRAALLILQPSKSLIQKCVPTNELLQCMSTASRSSGRRVRQQELQVYMHTALSKAVPSLFSAYHGSFSLIYQVFCRRSLLKSSLRLRLWVWNLHMKNGRYM